MSPHSLLWFHLTVRKHTTGSCILHMFFHQMSCGEGSSLPRPLKGKGLWSSLILIYKQILSVSLHFICPNLTFCEIRDCVWWKRLLMCALWAFHFTFICSSLVMSQLTNLQEPGPCVLNSASRASPAAAETHECSKSHILHLLLAHTGWHGEQVAWLDAFCSCTLTNCDVALRNTYLLLHKTPHWLHFPLKTDAK